MRNTEISIFANMCMIRDNKGRVVLQKRPGPVWPGWAFPGGHVEDKEPFTHAIHREIREETGLTVCDLQLCGIKDWIREDGIRYVVHLYKANAITDTLASSEEGIVQWFSLEELSVLPLAEGMTTLVSLFLCDDLTEQYFSRYDGQQIELLH